MSSSEVYDDRGPARTAAMFPIGTAAAEARRLPRARCPVCGRDVALRVGDALREHRRIAGQPKLCSGSGLVQLEPGHWRAGGDRHVR